ncbi:MAG: hypothetical protein A2096_01805 [Spirochaetes bacterium GWF1_41_5]|nr:MAG: hypothetical protein A2096_01805 [Spirochaetes bacterium GWF1_41_5]HBE02758.1 hypothetical protein [Spirochaetia bacterium]
MKRINFFIIILIMTTFSLHAAFIEHPDIDARGESVGSAVVTLGSDGNSVNNNPALLGTVDLISLTVTGSPLSLGVEDSSLINCLLAHGVVPFKGAGALGISANLLLVHAEIEGISKNLYNEYEFSLAYGYAINSSFQVGLTAKLQTWSIGKDLGAEFDDIDAPLTFNANIGAIFKPIPELSIGLAGINLIGMKINSKSSTSAKENVPRSVKAGVGYISPIINVAGDVEFVFDTTDFNIYVGTEKNFFANLFRVGAGIKLLNISDGVVPTAGFGITLKMFKVDYAFSYPISSIAPYGNHKLTAGVRF